MANNSFMVFTPYNGSGFGTPLKTESTSNFGLRDLATGAPIADNTLLPLATYSVDLDQTLSIGSAGSTASAGKVQFNPLSIHKDVDVLTPTFFQMCAAGIPFAKLDLLTFRPASASSGSFQFLQYTFKLVAIATLAYSPSDTRPQEVVSFGYGDMQIRYQQQGVNGGPVGPLLKAGWNLITNTADTGPQPV